MKFKSLSKVFSLFNSAEKTKKTCLIIITFSIFLFVLLNLFSFWYYYVGDPAKRCQNRCDCTTCDKENPQCYSICVNQMYRGGGLR